VRHMLVRASYACACVTCLCVRHMLVRAWVGERGQVFACLRMSVCGCVGCQLFMNMFCIYIVCTCACAWCAFVCPYICNWRNSCFVHSCTCSHHFLLQNCTASTLNHLSACPTPHLRFYPTHNSSFSSRPYFLQGYIHAPQSSSERLPT